MHSVNIPIRFAYPVSHYPHRPELANDITTRRGGIQNFHYIDAVIEHKAPGPDREDENMVPDKNFDVNFSPGVHGPLTAVASLDFDHFNPRRYKAALCRIRYCNG